MACSSASDGTWLFQLNVTRACNLRCAHCYIHSDVKAASGRMAADDAVAASAGIRRHILANPGKQAEIHVIGGEPTMMGLPWFEDVLPRMREALGDAPHRLVLVSNLLVDDPVPFARFFDHVATSWEPSTRFTKDKQQERWLRSVQALRAAGIVPSVTVAMAKPTIAHGASVLLDRLFFTFGFRHLHFGFFIPEGDGLAAGESMSPLFSETSDFLIEAADWYAARRAFEEKEGAPEEERVRMNPIEGMLSALSTGEPSDDLICPMIPGSMDIDWNGNAASCLEAGGSLSPRWLGNAFESGVAELADSPSFKKERAWASSPRGACRSCPEFNVCRGACSVLWRSWSEAQGDCPGFRRFILHMKDLLGEGLPPRSDLRRDGCR